ncbi:hypothetical protein ACIPL1_23300 [Pseudomonas sp. NPDC090202]|uniref:hypothetical protein n=1 Tax=unclassified Pseudomonas TaxID=196821 RepID=UPI00381E0EA1
MKMEPIDELTHSLTSLLESIAEHKSGLDPQGRKSLLDALRKLLKATETLNAQVQTLTRQQAEVQRQRPHLYLVD